MSRWIEYVKSFAKKNNLSYSKALSSKECSASFRKKYGKGLNSSRYSAWDQYDRRQQFQYLRLKGIGFPEFDNIESWSHNKFSILNDLIQQNGGFENYIAELKKIKAVNEIGERRNLPEVIQKEIKSFI